MVAFQYRFVTTANDLVDADAIDRAQQPARLYRWLVDCARQLDRTQRLVIGGLLGLGLLVFLVMSSWGDRLAVAAVAGLLPLYQFVVAPRRARARILSSNPPRKSVQIDVGKDGVSLEVESAGPVRTPWIEFTRIADTRRGVLLYFESMKLLLPLRAFTNDDERREFVKFVKQYEPSDTPL